MNPMRTEHLFGVLAGFLVALLGFLILGFGSSVSAISLAGQTSYVGGIEVAPADGFGAVWSKDDVNSPYSLKTSDHWQSPAERWLKAFGLMVVALLGGATAARVGSPVKAWRGALSVALAAVCFIVWLELRFETAASLAGSVALALSFALPAGLVGGAGGMLVRRFANT